MREAIRATAALVLLLAATSAEKPRAERAFVFEPAEVLAVSDMYYPPQSVAFGTVVLQVVIGESGQIEDVKVIRHIPSLTEEALRSVKKWKFKPATLDGQPVRSVIPVAFTFTRRQLFPIPKGQ